MRFLLLVFFFILSCTTQETCIQGTVFCMPFTLKVQARAKSHELRQKVFAIFDIINKQVNHFNPNSIISKFNRAKAYQSFKTTALIHELLTESKCLYDLSQKRFDPTYSNFNNIVFDENTFFKTENNLKIDLNAISKGKAIDLIADALQEMGYVNFIINWGGEIYVSNSKSKSCINISGSTHKIHVKNKAIATSGTLQISKGDQTHFIDTFTNCPICLKDVHYESVTVTANTCSTADVLATCAFLFKNQAELCAWIKAVQQQIPSRFYLLKKDKTLIVK